MKTGGQLIVDSLEANGVDRIFSVPGESYLAVLDALHDSNIRNIVCRQEGGAAMMADCHGRLTGQPGICFVTRGPGATNASPGVHIAMQDSTPMILFIGQVASHAREREAFQEVDYRAFFGPIAKWATEIDDAARIPEILTRAFSVATSGRPGPVVISLPEDMLTSVVDAPAALSYTPVETRPGNAEMEELAALLKDAKRPFVILGGSRWNEKAVADFQKAAEAWSLPVGCSFRRQMLFDHLPPSYAGDVGIGPNPKLAAAVREVGYPMVSWSAANESYAVANSSASALELRNHMSYTKKPRAIGARSKKHPRNSTQLVAEGVTSARICGRLSQLVVPQTSSMYRWSPACRRFSDALWYVFSCAHMSCSQTRGRSASEAAASPRTLAAAPLHHTTSHRLTKTASYRKPCAASCWALSRTARCMPSSWDMVRPQLPGKLRICGCSAA